jgi:electron transfer flavoprotein alpha subunit
VEARAAPRGRARSGGDLGRQVELGEADVIVSGGRSLKSAENFRIIEKLADVLGAARRCVVPRSTRLPAATAGRWARPARSSTRRCTSPASRAPSNLVGMRSRGDRRDQQGRERADLQADYGIVGDLFGRAALTEEFRSMLAK